MTFETMTSVKYHWAYLCDDQDIHGAFVLIESTWDEAIPVGVHNRRVKYMVNLHIDVKFSNQLSIYKEYLEKWIRTPNYLDQSSFVVKFIFHLALSLFQLPAKIRQTLVDWEGKVYNNLFMKILSNFTSYSKIQQTQC